MAPHTDVFLNPGLSYLIRPVRVRVCTFLVGRGFWTVFGHSVVHVSSPVCLVHLHRSPHGSSTTAVLILTSIDACFQARIDKDHSKAATPARMFMTHICPVRRVLPILLSQRRNYGLLCPQFGSLGSLSVPPPFPEGLISWRRSLVYHTLLVTRSEVLVDPRGCLHACTT